MDKQYRRALTLLKGSDSDLIEQDVRFRYLAAKCLVECREWEECLMMVGGWEEDSLDSIDMQVLIIVWLFMLQSPRYSRIHVGIAWWKNACERSRPSSQFRC